MELPLDNLAERIRVHPKLVIADDFEIALQRTTSQERKIQNGSSTEETQSARLWVSLRILHRKRGGKAVLLNPTLESIGTLVEAAFESANRSAVDPWFRFPIWKPRTLPAFDRVSAPFEYASLFSTLPPECEFLEETYEAAETETYLRRKSEKKDLRHFSVAHGARFSLAAHASGNLALFKEERAGAAGLPDRERWLAALAQGAVARLQRSAKPAGRGARNVLLVPRVGAQLLRALAPAFYADQVQNGRSPLSALLGENAFSPAITLVDDGNEPHSVCARPFDLEGAATQRTVVVEKGNIKTWLYDVYAATRDNRMSTGNFMRAPGQLSARVGASCFHLAPGEKTFGELITQMSNGVLIDNLDTLESLPADPTRVFLRGTGWRVAFGEASEPLRDIEAEIDLVALLRSASAVGKDLSFFGSYGSPSILLDQVPLGS